MKMIVPLVLALCLQAGAALAHAGLDHADPADGARVAAPAALSLTFTETVSLEFSGIVLIGPDGAEVPLGTATLSDDGATLIVQPAAALPPGLYTVDWHALSEDGHRVEGSYGFVVQ